MPTTLRRLKLTDHAEVTKLCGTLEDHDYVPDVFPEWAKSKDSVPIGVFEKDELVAITTLNLIPGSHIAWVHGLRVKAGHHRQGLGLTVVSHIIGLAKGKGVTALWYSTGNRNEASMGLARKAGFTLVDTVGTFRIEKPFPPHPKPSPVILPLSVSPDRLEEILMANPELVETNTLPFSWDFDFKTRDGLRRLGAQTDFNVMIGDEGQCTGLFYGKTFQRNDMKIMTFSVFSTDQAMFIDIIARALDTLEGSGSDRGVFFVRPRTKPWAVSLGVVPDEYLDTSYHLFQLDPQKTASKGRTSPEFR